MDSKTLGNNILIMGDCIDSLKELAEKNVKVDVIITDPPYELEFHGGGVSKLHDRYQTDRTKESIKHMSSGFDIETCFDLCFKLQNVPNIITFCSDKQLIKILSYFKSKKLKTTVLVWNKYNAPPMAYGKYISDIEYMVFARSKGATWNYDEPSKSKHKVKTYPMVSGKVKVHPCQKPVELLEELVKVHSLEDGIVLDPFMGSGSTCIACMNTNRRFIGIEKEEKYYINAIDRIKKEL